ncbi:Bug family tripartite tricarboxylate transporter substrate binding protein [Plastoroseomonas arctica]|uniref:Tripartite tricarboxylate transporter substrate binding protein n=1 Tax=Plastoroseomonas arctica TaxID=1509237 RepID=A0AAF1JUV9_9PROT|nr:tripartite tricarboxylate transporter substrate binding protein [Plastoroseomonas arctica]MBR0653959.1 tripartite tricarboxylate transporter substrate binding protein [Plastoroseomonas arctica]
MPTRRSLAALAGLAMPNIARAQAAWPNEKVVEVVVPFPAGGGVDVMTRLIMPLVAQRIPGLRPVVLNRTGAAGQIGLEVTFNAAPDGYTLGATTLPAVNSIALERQVRFRPMEFTYLANIVEDGNCFYVRQESPIRDVAHLIELARARPGQLTYATTGIGSDDHIFMVGFEAATGIPPMIHIPFAGAAPLIPQMLGGHFDVAAMNVGDCLALKREGKARCLAQANRTRWSEAADVPTFRELGMDVVYGASRGIVGPPGLPRAIAERLENALREAVADPAFTREAERQLMPLRPVFGREYAAMAMEIDQRVQALWHARPWRG